MIKKQKTKIPLFKIGYRGYAMAELPVMTLFMAVSFLSLMTLVYRGSQSHIKTRRLTAATLVAQSWLDGVLGLPYDDPLFGTPSKSITLADKGSGNYPKPGDFPRLGNAMADDMSLTWNFTDQTVTGIQQRKIDVQIKFVNGANPVDSKTLKWSTLMVNTP